MGHVVKLMPANKLARSAWSVLARARTFETNKLQAA
jgi:hypothetical protein